MRRNICKTYECVDFASIGIGGLIIFIAMVLVAGIAASVLIQTSTSLESQASSTGRQTTAEVSTGVSVFSIEGYATTGSDISKLAIMIRPRAGTDEIDLIRAHIELSNSDKKVILNYSTSFFSKPTTGADDIFSTTCFPDDNWGYGHANNTDGSRFGILVLEDYDSSIVFTNPVLNRGDKIYLCINTTGVFNNIAENTDMWGMVVIENGYPGIIKFRTPNTYSDNVMELQLDL